MQFYSNDNWFGFLCIFLLLYSLERNNGITYSSKVTFYAPVQHSHISNSLFRGSLKRPFLKTDVSLETLGHLSLISSIMNNLVFSSLSSNFLLHHSVSWKCILNLKAMLVTEFWMIALESTFFPTKKSLVLMRLLDFLIGLSQSWEYLF